MSQPHVIELALDLARMPALARSSVAPTIPPNVVELMQIAAGSVEACEVAAVKTGEPSTVLIEAARFYLQQVLFRSDADCYRILGIKPSTSREMARNHMRWLLEWLHPDRNKNSWDAVYAERVLKAWREVSAANGSDVKTGLSLARQSSDRKKKGYNQRIRLPWIDRPGERQSLARSPRRSFILWALPMGLVIIFLALWSANVFFEH